MAAPAEEGPPYTAFEPAPPFEELPEDVQACIQGPTPHCDTSVIGSYLVPGSLCAMAQYRQTEYCACVNNAQACPIFNDAKECGNSPVAYRPTTMTGGAAEDACKGATFCVNLVEALGGGDVVANINQSCGPGTLLTAALANHPVLSALAFILLLALVFLLGGVGGGAGGAGGASGASGASGAAKPQAPPGKRI